MGRWNQPDAVVVGSGPNGLAAAITLAREGFRVVVLEAFSEPGGGTRSMEDPEFPGLLHDRCSAVHPMGVAAPFLRSLPLERFGLQWCWPELDLAHPLEGGRAGVMQRGLAATADGLGADAGRWRSVFGPVTRWFDEVSHDLLRPLLRIPRHPLKTAVAGSPGLLPASSIARRFRTDEAAALFGGIAAHAMVPLTAPMSAAGGLLLGGAGQHLGWPVARGGSQAIWKAMVGYLEELGGEVVTDTHVRDFAELPRTRVVLFDTTPTQLAWILGTRMPARARRRTERWRYGPAAYKLDFVVRGEVPWAAPAARRAGTLHLGGTFEEVVAAEAAASLGEHVERPFVLVAQPHVADPTRRVGELTPLWTYAHVPHGSVQDAGPQIEAQIERFAPGFGDRVVARHAMSPADLEAYDPNLLGGDISGGANTPGQLLARPRLSPDPYLTAVPGVYLCSASTPPGGGVHGVSGHLAARSALRVLTR